MRKVLAATLAGAVLLTSGLAEAGPPRDNQDKPWGRGVFSVGGGLGGSFFGDGGGSLVFGVNAEYFVWHGIGLGLGYSNQFLFLSDSYKRNFPGIEDRVPTYFGYLSPTLRVFLFRSFRFSPYVIGGTGPVFLNNQQPTLGQWQAGGGVYIGLGRSAALDIGVGVSQLYTRSACERATGETFTAQQTGRTSDTRVFVNTCAIGIFPRIGIVFGFGGKKEGDRKTRREKKRERETEGWVPPEDAPSEGEPPPEYAPAPEPVAPTPVEEVPGYEAPAEPDPEPVVPAPEESIPPEGSPPVEGEPGPVADPEPPAGDLPPAPDGAEPPVDAPVEEPGEPSAPPVQTPTPLPDGG